MISVKSCHAITSRGKVFPRISHFNYLCHALYLVDNCHVFQSGVQEPLAYILRLVLTFFNILYVWVFLFICIFFQGKFWGFSS